MSGLPKPRDQGGAASSRTAKAPTPAQPMRSQNALSSAHRELSPNSKYSNAGNSGFNGALAGKGLPPPIQRQISVPSASGAAKPQLSARGQQPPATASSISARADLGARSSGMSAASKVVNNVPSLGLGEPRKPAASLSAPVTPALSANNRPPPARKPPGPIKAPTAADMAAVQSGVNTMSTGGGPSGSAPLQSFTSMVGNQAANLQQGPSEADALEVARLVEQAKWKQMQRNVYSPHPTMPQSINLNLASRSLRTLTPDVVALDRMTVLNLSDNLIEIIPSTISSLTQLTSLNINNNRILSIPPEVSTLKNLTELGLSGNRIKTLPQFIGNLPNLSKLYLGRNRLSELPASIDKLVELKVLSLHHNEFAKAPAMVAGMPLRELHLSYNKLALIPEEYCHMTTLQELHVDCNKLTTLPRSIGLLSNLKVLSCSNNDLQSLPRGITTMTSLVTLNLCCNKLDILPLGFNQMGVREFDLSYNPLSLDDIAGGFLNQLLSNGVRGSDQKPLLRTHCPLVNVNGRLPIGSGLIQGKREYMEDRIVIENDLAGQDGDFLVAILDGHGGEDCAEHCRDVLLSVYKSCLQQSVGVLTALSDTFQVLHQQIKDRKITSGSTGTVGVMMNKTLYLANAGDSRAVLCQKGLGVRLSVEHKGCNAAEEDRIVKLGGFVVDGRVNRILAVTRALGDVDLNPFVIPDPDVKVVDIGPDDEYLILASDGVWDVISDNEACSLAMSAPNAQAAAIKIRDVAYMNGSMDNISTIVVALKPPKAGRK